MKIASINNTPVILSHRADVMVAADRIFRSVMRASKSAGAKLPIALRRANEITLRETGIDMLSELQIEVTGNKNYLGSASHLNFLDSWLLNELPVPCAPCSSVQLYAAYQAWQKEQGGLIQPINKVLESVESHCGFSKKRVRYNEKGSMCTMVWPHGNWSQSRVEINQYILDFQYSLDQWLSE